MEADTGLQLLEGCVREGWASLPPELLRRVVHQLLTDWHYVEPAKPVSSLLPVRSTCKAWRAVVDADIHHVALTVPSVAPAYLGTHFPHATSLDLSRYQRSCSDIFPVMQQLNLRSLVLADPWDSPGHLPVQFLTQLTHLSFLAEGLLVPRLAAQFCEALSKLPLLHTLALSRLQLSAQAAQLLGQTLMELPRLSQLALSGGAAPVGAAELYVLLNVELPGLRALELTRLGVRMLPLSLTRLAGLTRLTFSGEMLRNVQLRDELRQLSNLQVLDISANLSEQLPVGVLELSGLRELHAGMNRLGVHMHSFRRLEELQVLVLASNKLVGVHPSLWCLASLVRLDLGHNNLTELPADVSQLTGLTFLSVCHNFLTALPSGLSCLTALEELDVSLNTDMRELPTGLGQLANLTRLTASHMRLKQLPVDVGGLVSLVHLDVSHNSLHHLSAALSCLTGLTHLEASDNKLHQSAAVPEELASLTALRVLRLARNRLQSLPEALGCYQALRLLDCSGNRLTSVPRVVGRCTALQQLLMASNRLRGLTSGIGNLVRLQLLDLSHNQYRHLPTMMGDLTQLQCLLLEDNQLEDLPSSCSALVKLSQLTLSCNRLHVLPPAISRMSGLLSLTLRDNPLLGRDVVLLQLQRQLPALTVDDLAPPQGQGSRGGQQQQQQQGSARAAAGSSAGVAGDSLLQQPWASLSGAGAAPSVSLTALTEAAAALAAAALPAAAQQAAVAPGAGAAAAAAGMQPAVPSGLAGGPRPPWVRGASGACSLVQMLQQIVESAVQEQPQPGAFSRLALMQQHPDDVLAAAAGPLLRLGSNPLPEAQPVEAGAGSQAALAAAAAPADAAGSSSAAAAAAAGPSSSGASSAQPERLLGSGRGATANAGTPCPWQRLLAAPPQVNFPSLQQALAAASAAGGQGHASPEAASNDQQPQQGAYRLEQLEHEIQVAQEAEPSVPQDARGSGSSSSQAALGPASQQQQQQQQPPIPCGPQLPDEEDSSEEGASLARSSSHLGSLDGGYLSSLDGGNGSNGGAGGAGPAAAAAAATAAATTGLSALSLQSANSIGNSSGFRVKSYLEAASSSNNSSAGGAAGGSAEFSRQGSVGLARVSEPGNGSYTQQQLRAEGPFAVAASMHAKNQGAASSSAAAAAACVACADNDDECSAAGLDSGSEDSGSEVLVRLGTPQNSNPQAAYAYLQHSMRGGMGGVDAMQQGATSATAANTGAGGLGELPAGVAAGLGSSGLPAGLTSAAASEGGDADADSCTTNGDEGEASAAAAPAVGAGQQQQQQQRQAVAERSFAHVLEHAWWGRRKG